MVIVCTAMGNSKLGLRLDQHGNDFNALTGIYSDEIFPSLLGQADERERQVVRPEEASQQSNETVSAAAASPDSDLDNMRTQALGDFARDHTAYWVMADITPIMESLDKCKTLKVSEADIREYMPGISMKLYEEALCRTDCHIDAAKNVFQKINYHLDKATEHIMSRRQEKVEDRNLEPLPSVEEILKQKGMYQRVEEERCKTPHAGLTIDKKAASVGSSRFALTRSTSSTIRLVGPDGRDIIKDSKVSFPLVSALSDEISKRVAEHPDKDPFKTILSVATEHQALATLTSKEAPDRADVRDELAKILHPVKDLDTSDENIIKKSLSLSLSDEKLAPKYVKASGNIPYRDLFDDRVCGEDREADAGKPPPSPTRTNAKTHRRRDPYLPMGPPISSEDKTAEIISTILRNKAAILDRMHDLRYEDHEKNDDYTGRIKTLVKLYNMEDRAQQRWEITSIPLSERDEEFNRRIASAIRHLSKEKQEEMYKELEAMRIDVDAVKEMVIAEEKKDKKEECDLCREPGCTKVDKGTLCSKHKANYNG